MLGKKKKTIMTMKRIFLLTVFATLTSLMSLAQEMVLECKYSSNQSYKTLLVIDATGGEAVSMGGDKKCHYDLEVESMGDHIVILAHNASLSSWVDDLYILSPGGKCFVVSPAMSDGNNFAKLEVEQIEGDSAIAAKKREYGLTGSNSYNGGQGKSSSL